MQSLFSSFDNIITFDVETTGLDFKRDEIIEFAALRAVNERSIPVVKDKVNFYVELSPCKYIPEKVTDLTGITEKLLKDKGIGKEDACKRITDMLTYNNALLVAYNAQFDLCFLYHFLNRYKKADRLKSVKMLDLLTVYKDRKPYPHKLSDAISTYFINTTNTHRASDDVAAAFELLDKMGAEEDDLIRYVNLFGYNPKYGVSGSRISSVKYMPQAYDAQKKIYESVTMKKVGCALCNGHYFIREGKRGLFAGCSSFPQCKSSKEIFEYVLEAIKAYGINIYKWDKDCWKCKRETPVYSYYLCYDLADFDEHFEFGGYPEIGLGDINYIDKVLSQKYPTIKVKYSNTTKDSYMANTCKHCGALQGRNYVVDDPHEIIGDLWNSRGMEKYLLETIYCNKAEEIYNDIKRLFS